MSKARHWRLAKWLITSTAALTAIGVALIYLRHGGGNTLPDLTSSPKRDFRDIEVVAQLEMPPCNLAVSAEDRLFFSYSPETHPDVNVVEWKNGAAVPYPNAQMNNGQAVLHFQSVQAIRIDRFNRLWVLDHGHHGTGQPRVMAFDLSSSRMVYRHDFPTAVAPLGSQLNDFNIEPQGRYLYIADASVFGMRPALVIHDVLLKRSRRVLEDDPSVTAEPYYITAEGKPAVVAGVFAVRPHVDSIALDQSGQWLYFAPITNRHLYRVKTQDLNNVSLSTTELGRRVQRHAIKTASDSISVDEDGAIYVANPEQSAVNVITADGVLHTLFKDRRLRWPDGIGFGPNGWVYVSNSALGDTLMRSRSGIVQDGPYTIIRFKASRTGRPGQ